MPLSRRHAAPTLLVGLLSLMPAAGAAPALPFEPVPSSFQTWLNRRQSWPNGQTLQFSRIAQCLDQTTRPSPYRTPVFTCLSGEVRITGGERPAQICRLQRVSYFPKTKQARYWTAQCRPAG
jgi:hypothetical protein